MKISKKICASLGGLCLFFLAYATQAQTHEIGLMGGAANYRGELAQVVNLDSPEIFGGGFYRANLGKALSARINVAFARISADDADSDDAFAQARNHSFETALLELSLQVEYNFLHFRGTRRDPGQSWSPYLFTGLGFFKMDPVDNAQPTYNTSQGNIPLGVGIKAILWRNVNIGAEIGARFTFTDFLDDVGVDVDESRLTNRDPKFYTGNPNNNDMYFFSGITLSYVFPDPGEDCPVNIPR